MTVDVAGVILCGGKSTRMGEAKAWLPFGDELLLQRVVRRLSEVAAPLVVVAAPAQVLPALPPLVEILRDPVTGGGPLQGIAVGLDALVSQGRYAFVGSTDAPFVAAAFIRRLRALAEGHAAAVVRANGHDHVLAAVYATKLGARARQLLVSGERSVLALLDHGSTRFVEPAELLADRDLCETDPKLMSLDNVNSPSEYHAALSAAGLRR